MKQNIVFVNQPLAAMAVLVKKKEILLFVNVHPDSADLYVVGILMIVRPTHASWETV